MAKEQKQLAIDDMFKPKTLHMGLACDLFGSKTSIVADHNVTLKPMAWGIMMYSKKSNRAMFLPWANCKAAELLTTPELLEFFGIEKK